jgi:hypothetical protein
MHQRRDSTMDSVRANACGTGWGVEIMRHGVTHQRSFSVARTGLSVF